MRASVCPFMAQKGRLAGRLSSSSGHSTAFKQFALPFSSMRRGKQSGAIKAERRVSSSIHHSQLGHDDVLHSIDFLPRAPFPVFVGKKKSLDLPLFVVFDSASAMSARSFFSGGWLDM